MSIIDGQFHLGLSIPLSVWNKMKSSYFLFQLIDSLMFYMRHKMKPSRWEKI